jgi:hypothetical protein
MTAGELAPGARFTLPGGETVFTVEEQWPSRTEGGSLTRCTSENARMGERDGTLFNARTVVVPVDQTGAPGQ